MKKTPTHAHTKNNYSYAWLWQNKGSNKKKFVWLPNKMLTSWCRTYWQITSAQLTDSIESFN